VLINHDVGVGRENCEHKLWQRLRNCSSENV